MMSGLVRRCIRMLEYILVFTVVLFFVLSYYDILFNSEKYTRPVFFYLLSLSFYNYVLVLFKSSGSLTEFRDIEICGMCKVCNRLQSSRTFHCESCNRCSYKRDHHCPWIGKCVASSNYKEFYLFIFFLLLYLFSSIFLRPSMIKASIFILNYLFVIILLFFGWMNLLLCVDKSSLEYYKGGRPIRYKSFWTRINGKKYRERIKKNVLDGEVENIATIFFPFLKRKASIVGQDR